MSPNEAAERIGRYIDPRFSVGNVVTIITLIVGLVAGYTQLSGTVAATAATLTTVANQMQAIQRDASAMDGRVTKLEERANIVGKSRDEFQRDTQLALKELSAVLSDLRQNDSRILQRLDDLKGANP